ncbi:beta-glucosidase [Ekhidna lutea]|uniref:beta-glucosidase n=1 Tax=Ekhidna lutea TaxID=447679 RepID=A0A239LVR0_EKHLU|nr:beta-glucosidase BglX [Ekhidna lutea]SNT34551.1 beta-glucosidase [Ekhidna lutea]
MKNSLLNPIKSIAICFILAFNSSCDDQGQSATAEGGMDQKVDNLLTLMTIDEKIGQTIMYNGTWEFTGPVSGDNQWKAEKIKNGQVGAMLNVLTADEIRRTQELAVNNSRLGIPMVFAYDVIHGYKTMLPVPLAQAASWDPEVARLGSEVAAREASAAGLHWTFAPMIDISRDARWGRIMESPGEDPYLASIMAKAWVEGYQGDDLSSPTTIAACAKHFAGYGFAEAGRDYNTVEVSMQTLYNVILPPFKAASDAGVATFMNGFNDLNGVPATGNEFLQRDILKGEWNYDGMMVSDWGSIPEMIFHGYAKDTAQAAAMAMIAGSDMDMEGRVYEKGLKEKIQQGEVSEDLLDDAVRRILKLKFKLGLFDDPYRYSDAQREKEELLSAESLAAARDAARKSIVLLKNESSILPLQKEINSIAVIGQLAAHKDIPLGSWRAQAVPNSAVSLLEGIKGAVTKDTKVAFAKGYTLTTGHRSFGRELTIVEEDKSGFTEAVNLAKSSDVVVLAMGEDCYQSGEGRSQIDVGLKGSQIDLLNELKKVNDNIVVVLMTGRPVAIPEIAADANAILEAWFGGSEAGNAIADVLFGDYNPSGKLPVSFPYHTGQEPLYYSQKSTGRPINRAENVFWTHYTDGPNDALFPFGYGLSYTSFNYENFKVSKEEESISISVDVTNSGDMDGEEVVQLYIQDVAASLVRPIKELKGFEKVWFAAGETKAIKFMLSKDELSFYNEMGELVFEPGEFRISVGSNSRDLNTQSITLN